jgi:aryl-alcohol dehydrogenase-like predicted oxidoreductase/predicted DsbA family dithiol-disulfide isomerase
MTVEVWSDVVCPWCYIGKRRLEAAIDELGGGVRVLWRSFQLDPSAPRPGEPGHGQDVATHLGHKYGGGREAGLQMSARVTEVAAGDGLEFHLDRAVRGSTADAHRLIHLAATLEQQGARAGLQDQVKERFLRAYFTEGQDVSHPDVLRALAVEAGLPVQQVDDVLGSSAFARDVLTDQAQAQAYGATGVPFTVVDGRYGVSGAQPVEVFLEALRRARADRAPHIVQVTGVAGASGTGMDTQAPAGDDARAARRGHRRAARMAAPYRSSEDGPMTTTMQTRQIGDVTVSAIGLGGMPMSIEGRPDRERSIATVHASLEAGVTFIDTADAYHLHADEVGHNETLIDEALASWGGDRDSVLVATKSGHLRPGDGSWTQDGRPEHIKAAAKASSTRLGGDAIGLHQLHRPDPQVPYAESVGALAELLDEGVIRMAGISNADPEQIREAQQVLGGRLVSVQNQFSPQFRSSEPELRLCHELGIAFLPWSPLGGIKGAADLTPGLAPFAAVAQAHGVTPQQVTLAWLLAKSPVVVPIPGSSRPETARASAEAVGLRLSEDEVAVLDATDHPTD